MTMTMTMTITTTIAKKGHSAVVKTSTISIGIWSTRDLNTNTVKIVFRWIKFTIWSQWMILSNFGLPVIKSYCISELCKLVCHALKKVCSDTHISNIITTITFATIVIITMITIFLITLNAIANLITGHSMMPGRHDCPDEKGEKTRRKKISRTARRWQ